MAPATPEPDPRRIPIVAGVGVTIVLIPLLPGAARYAGYPSRLLSDGLVVLLCCLAVMVSRKLPLRAPDGRAPRWVGRAWALLLMLAGFSAVHGLLAEFGATSPVFSAHLRETGSRWLQPVSAVSDPLFPLLAFATVLSGAATYFAVVSVCRRLNLESRDKLLAAFVGAGSLVAVLAMLQKAARFELHPHWLRANPFHIRAHATLPDPNALGSFLLLVLAASVALSGSGKRRIPSAVAAALAVGGILASGSRAAMIPLVAIAAPTAALATWGWVHSGSEGVRWRRAVAVAVVFVALGGLLVSTQLAESPTDFTSTYLPDGPIDALVQTIEGRFGMDAGRMPWWELSLTYARDYPVTGVGLGRFACLLVANTTGRHEENAHSYPLQLLAVMGIPGAVAFLALALLTLLAVWLTDGRPTRRSSLVALLYLAFLATQATGHALLEPSVQACWAVFLGLLVSRSRAFGGAEASDGRESDSNAPGPLAPPHPDDPAPGAWRAPLVALVVLVLAWGAWGTARAASGDLPRCRGDWGTTWGLYPVETMPDGSPYRWTGESAILDLSHAEELRSGNVRLVVEAPQAALRRRAVQLWVSSDRGYETFSLEPDIQRELRLTPPPEGPWIIRLQVDGAFVPADLEGSNDSRLLGVKMRFVPAPGDRP